MAEEEFDNPERKELLESLVSVLPNIPGPTTWACLWLADIDKLRTIVQKARDSPYSFWHSVRTIEDAKLIPKWLQTNRDGTETSTPRPSATPSRRYSAALISQPSSATTVPRSATLMQVLAQEQAATPPSLRLSQELQSSPTLPSSPPQPSLAPLKRKHGEQTADNRSRDQSKQCYLRDLEMCVLTKAPDPDAAHIYPHCMRHEIRRGEQLTPADSIWAILDMFWSQDRVDAWYKAIFPSGMNACNNLISLTQTAHKWWGKAYFVLQPIELSEDNKRLTLRFIWLPPTSRTKRFNPDRPSLQTYLDHGPGSSKLFNVLTEKKICTGDTICLETDDPMLRPLPSFALLEMQWFLHRLAAMSGAAEPQEEDSDSDSDIEDDLPMAIQERLNLHEDMDMLEVPDMVPDRSSSTVPVPSPSPVRRVRGAPTDDNVKHATATHEGESIEMAAEDIMAL